MGSVDSLIDQSMASADESPEADGGVQENRGLQVESTSGSIGDDLQKPETADSSSQNGAAALSQNGTASLYDDAKADFSAGETEDAESRAVEVVDSGDEPVASASQEVHFASFKKQTNCEEAKVKQIKNDFNFPEGASIMPPGCCCVLCQLMQIAVKTCALATGKP